MPKQPGEARAGRRSRLPGASREPIIKHRHPPLRTSTLLAGRLLLALIFLHEGIVLALHFDASVKAMALQGVGLPPSWP